MWAHKNPSLDALYNYQWADHRFLQQRGYVFWDKARWEKWRILDEEWQEDPPSEHDPESYDREQYDRQYKEMEVSFKVRHDICRRGGKGYWALDDESKVQWPNGSPPPDWTLKDLLTEFMSPKLDPETEKRKQCSAREPEQYHDPSKDWPSDLQGWSKFFKQRR